MTVERGRFPDDAVIVRCGRPPFDHPVPLWKRCGEHPEGVYGFSVQCAAGKTPAELARWCPNRSVGFTTVGEIRALGYDAVRTGGIGDHATLVVPRDWGEVGAQRLVLCFREAINPEPRAPR